MRASRPYTARIVATVVALAVAATASWTLLHLTRKGAESALNPGGFRNLAGNATFVGDAVCVSCHEEIAESYARTGMARSWNRITDADRIESTGSGDKLTVRSPAEQLEYQLRWREDGHLEVTETITGPGAGLVPPLKVLAEYVLGSGHKGRSYILDCNGYLWLMPVAWYSAPSTWSLSPGFEHGNRRFSRAIVPRCLACHNGYANYEPYSDSKYEPPLPTGITCERCHGPGSLHVAERQNDPPNRPRTGKDLTIVNPAHLAPALQQDVCLQCHLSTEVAVVMRGGASAFDYQPGQPLHLFRLDFQLAGPEAEELSAVSHGTRMVLSRCYTRSGGKLVCTYCHAPHKPSWEIPRDAYNARCLTCHSVESCTRPATLEKTHPLAAYFEQAHRSADCISCHMPRRDPKDIRHTTTTDHWIRKDAVFDRTAPPGPPKPPDRFVALVDFFRVATPGERGIAHVMYGHTWQRADYLQFGLRLLNAALRRHPDDPRLLYWASLARADLGEMGVAQELAWRAYQRVNLFQQDSGLTEEEKLDLCLDLIHYFTQTDNLEAAAQVADRLLHLAPASREANNARIRIALLRGNLDLARTLARQATARDGSNWLAWNFLAAVLISQKGDSDAALAAAEKALQWNPLDIRTWLTYARACEYAGDAEKAARVLQATSQRFPRAVEPLLALAELFRSKGNVREARRYLLRARAIDSTDPRVRALARKLAGRPERKSALEERSP